MKQFYNKNEPHTNMKKKKLFLTGLFKINLKKANHLKKKIICSQMNYF